MAEKLRNTNLLNFSRGVNVKIPVLQTRPGEAVIADNCYRDTVFGVEKRKGNVLVDQLANAAVNGIHNHEYLAGTTKRHHQLFGHRDGRVFRRTETGPTASVGTIFDPVTASRTSFATAHGHTYIAQAGGRLTNYDGSERRYAGITAPTVIPTGSGSATGITGSYKLKYTYFYKTEDNRIIESNPSTESAAVSVTNKTIDWVWTAPPNNGERYTGVRLYRTGNGGQVYFFLTQIDDITTLTYADTTEDIFLITAVSTDHNVPPTGPAGCVFWQERLWIWGVDGEPHTLRYSKRQEYEHFPEFNWVKLQMSSTERITGAKVLKGVLVVFTTDTIWHVTGSTAASYLPQKMTEHLGCLAPGSLQDLGNYLVFMWRDGFYAWNLSSYLQIGQRVEPFVEGNTEANLLGAVSAVYRKLNHYYCAFPFADGPTRWLVYDYTTMLASGSIENEEEARERSWFRFTGGLAATAMESCYDFTTRDEVLLWGDTDGQVLQADQGTTDNGVNIAMQLRFYVSPHEIGRDRPGAPDVDQSWRHWTVMTDTWTGAATFAWGYFYSTLKQSDGTRYNGIVFNEQAVTPDAVDDNNMTRINMNGRGRGFFAEVRHEVAGTFRMIGSSFWWRYEPFGVKGRELGA